MSEGGEWVLGREVLGEGVGVFTDLSRWEIRPAGKLANVDMAKKLFFCFFASATGTFFTFLPVVPILVFSLPGNSDRMFFHGSHCSCYSCSIHAFTDCTWIFIIV